MKLLAISDAYIPEAVMRRGLASLVPLGIEIEVRPWEHATLIELQQANLAIEQGGPSAVPLDAALVAGAEDVQILVVQFAPVDRRSLERLCLPCGLSGSCAAVARTSTSRRRPGAGSRCCTRRAQRQGRGRVHRRPDAG
jgi:hypothetical protein